MDRRLSIGLVVLLLSFASLPAMAQDYLACWRDRRFDAVLNDFMPVTRCRLAGGEIVDYASDDQVPTRLYPAVGTVGGVACWYYTSRFTGMWVVVVYPNGDADIAMGADPGVAVIVGLYGRCTSEPDTDDPVSEVWEYVTEYIHPPPTPDVSPAPGDGVTGLRTNLEMDVPTVHRATLASGTSALEVEIAVGTVIVHWGDGTIHSYPASAFIGTSPASHVYERRSHDGTLSVSFSWNVRWRAVGNVWQTLAVPDTTTSLGYPINEIVSVLGA
jgi:hypothetical protein